MTERLTDEQRASFRAYAESSMTEADGSQCQWADYTIRLLDEVESERAAHEETRRRLTDDKACLAKALQEAEREVERQDTEWDVDIKRAIRAESALEQARRELADLRQNMSVEDAGIVAEAHRIALELTGEFQQLASLLSCEPGQVVERVRDIHEAARLLVARHVPKEMTFDWSECLKRDLARMRDLLAPSRPASEPAETLYPCDNCGKLRTKAEGGTTFTVCDECWDKHYHPKPAPPASVAEQAQLCKARIWDNGDMTDCGFPLPCALHGQPAKPSEGE